MTNQINLSILKEYQSPWPFTLAEMCSKCGLTSLETEELISSDAICFSPNFKQPSLSRVRVVNAFTVSIKHIMDALDNQGLKTIFGLPKNMAPVFRSPRRTQGFIDPLVLVFMIQQVALPLYINLLSAYLKDAIDESSDHEESTVGNIELNMCIRETSLGKESWYKIEGRNAKEIATILESLKIPK